MGQCPMVPPSYDHHNGSDNNNTGRNMNKTTEPLFANMCLRINNTKRTSSINRPNDNNSSTHSKDNDDEQSLIPCSPVAMLQNISKPTNSVERFLVKHQPDKSERYLLNTKRISDEIKHVDGILHLSMKCNYSSFYEKTYLKQFPRHVAPGSALVKPVLDISPALIPVLSSQSKSFESEGAGSQDTTTNNHLPRRIRIENTNQHFLNLVVRGGLGLLSDSSSGSSRSINKSHFVDDPKVEQLILLDNLTKNPIAVCTLKSKYGPPVVHIHSPHPNRFSQAPSIKYEGNALYPWAEFKAEGEFPLPVRYSISFATGNSRFENEPTYKASHISVGSPDISVVGRHESESIYQGAAIISLSEHHHSHSCKTKYFTISVSRGVDPSLFICLAAIVDEVLEFTMRSQVITSRMGLVRKARG